MVPNASQQYSYLHTEPFLTVGRKTYFTYVQPAISAGKWLRTSHKLVLPFPLIG